MARRSIFRNRKRTPAGLNPASVLRPTKGITPRPSEQALEQPTGATSIQDEQMSSFAPDSNSEVTSLDNISDKVVQVENESSLPYVRNPYPVEIGTDPSGNYTADGGGIKLTGKYDENFLTFKK